MSLSSLRIIIDVRIYPALQRIIAYILDLVAVQASRGKLKRVVRGDGTKLHSVNI